VPLPFGHLAEAATARSNQRPAGALKNDVAAFNGEAAKAGATQIVVRPTT
jgi:hypothetical protein